MLPEMRIGIANPAGCKPDGAPVIWFDFELGEKSHLQGFVCDEHKISDRVEKLSM
jgi:hypothetical protein